MRSSSALPDSLIAGENAVLVSYFTVKVFQLHPIIMILDTVVAAAGVHVIVAATPSDDPELDHSVVLLRSKRFSRVALPDEEASSSTESIRVELKNF